MIGSLLYVLIAVAILSFLIFIHELGHYYTARRVGMRVDAFSIGLGRPIFTWKRDGVEWRLGWLPFGGYVKIAGGEEEEGVDPYQIRDGFFGRPPLDRIKVALAGPMANLFFALLIFFGLWAVGGRVKNFTDFTPIIGYVDPDSVLFKEGVRPGDEITYYGTHPYQSINDHLVAPMTQASDIRVRGNHVNHTTSERRPFEIQVQGYPNPLLFDKELLTAGILEPASYLIYDPKGQDLGPTSLAAGSPLLNSGIESGDRIVWANGESIFSQMQLARLMNNDRVLLTVQRDHKTFLRRVPRVLVQELKLDPDFREELVDWQYEAQLHRQKVLKLYAIPYNMTADGVVESVFKFIEPEQQQQAFPEVVTSPFNEPLEVGDRIVAVNGTPIKHAYELLGQLQEPKVLLIVLRGGDLSPTNIQQANVQLTQEINGPALQKLVAAIGLPDAPTAEGSLHLLPAITPKSYREFAVTPEAQARLTNELAKRKTAIEAIDNSDKRSQLLHKLEESEWQLHLAPPYFSDRKVVYNPSPLRMFGDVWEDIWRTLSALVSGRLSPKWMAGPIGIVQVVQENWKSSIKDGIYWIGVISLNLGILNLLPIPVLDGGSICFSLFEMITGRRLKPKTMEKLIIPFALLILTFILFLTYQDLLRIFGRFLKW